MAKKKVKTKKSAHGKKRKIKKTGRSASSDEEKLKGAKLARSGDTSLKAKGKKGFSHDEMLNRIL